MWQHPATQANLETLRSTRGNHRRARQRLPRLRHGRRGTGSPKRAPSSPQSRTRSRTQPRTQRIAALCRRDRADHRGRNPRAHRPGALHRQPLQRQDGIRSCRTGPMPRRARRCWSAPPPRSPSPRAASSSRSPPSRRCAPPSSITFRRASLVIMAAAVSDYRVVDASPEKLKRNGPRTLCSSSQPRTFCARSSSEERPQTLVIGFAAETENVLANGRSKLDAQRHRRPGRQRRLRKTRRASTPTATPAGFSPPTRPSSCPKAPRPPWPIASSTELSSCEPHALRRDISRWSFGSPVQFGRFISKSCPEITTIPTAI